MTDQVQRVEDLVSDASLAEVPGGSALLGAVATVFAED
jgi:hypothetical protein